jgi:hypothetical protein
MHTSMSELEAFFCGIRMTRSRVAFPSDRYPCLRGLRKPNLSQLWP